MSGLSVFSMQNANLIPNNFICRVPGYTFDNIGLAALKKFTNLYISNANSLKKTFFPV